MPYTIKTGYLNVKDENGQYIRNNTVAEQSTAEQVVDIEAAGAAQVTAINTKGVETLESIPDDYTALSNEVDDIKSALEDSFYINGNVRPTLINGKFVNSNGKINESSNFSMTEPIAVKKGQTVTLTAKGYLVNVAMIATCNSDNTSREVAVLSIDSDEHDYVYNVTEDGYIVCSFNTASSYKLTLIIDYYSKVNVVEESLYNIENALVFVNEGTDEIAVSVFGNGFVDATNNRYNTGGNFNTTNTLHLHKGQTVNLTAVGYRNVVGMINLYDSENDRYHAVVRSAENVTNYSYTAPLECDVRMCYLISAGASINVVTNETDSIRIQIIETEIEKLKAEPLGDVEYPQMFTNIICIGDSLTRGESGGSQSVQLTTNYPFYFSKLSGANCYNGGLSGRTAKQWWDEFGSTITGFANYDCAIIYLGTNGGLTDTVDTDCNASDYTQNADTNTGCYGKIIGKIKADSPNCKIFCVCGPNEYLGRENTMNSAVRNLSAFYDVGLIDIAHCLMDDNGSTQSVERYLYRPIDGIHYNRLGYMTFANMIYDYMKAYMANHLSKYS